MCVCVSGVPSASLTHSTFGSLSFPPLSVLINLFVPQRLEVLDVHRQQGALARRAAVGACALHTVSLRFI